MTTVIPQYLGIEAESVRLRQFRNIFYISFGYEIESTNDQIETGREESYFQV